MSAYVNRLIDRFSPGTGDMRAKAEPFVRSESPIAEFDQRPGSEDAFGFEDGPAPEQFANPEAPTASPSAQIHRKAIGQPVAPVSSPAASSVSAPAIAPIAPAPVAPPPAPTTATPSATRRREPLDPGPLFDIFPRYFDSPESTPTTQSSDPAPAMQSPVARNDRPAPSVTSPERVSPTRTSQSPVAFVPTPSRLEPAPARELELLTPGSEARRPAPWQPLERELPDRSPAVTPLVTPATPLERELAPSSPSPEREPAATPLLYANPRPSVPEPYVPAPSRNAAAQASATARPRVHIGHVEIEVIPSNPQTPAQSGPRTPKQKLSIDSISQIGPLEDRFPSRRLLRLRYR